jgi:hypothetical protein
MPAAAGTLQEDIATAQLGRNLQILRNCGCTHACHLPDGCNSWQTRYLACARAATDSPQQGARIATSIQNSVEVTEVNMTRSGSASCMPFAHIYVAFALECANGASAAMKAPHPTLEDARQAARPRPDTAVDQPATHAARLTFVLHKAPRELPRSNVQLHMRYPRLQLAAIHWPLVPCCSRPMARVSIPVAGAHATSRSFKCFLLERSGVPALPHVCRSSPTAERCWCGRHRVA